MNAQSLRVSSFDTSMGGELQIWLLLHDLQEFFEAADRYVYWIFPEGSAFVGLEVDIVLQIFLDQFFIEQTEVLAGMCIEYFFIVLAHHSNS